jgi:hypothetical protein
MPDQWIDEARAVLLGGLQPATGWGYRRGTAPCVEPTVLASLALIGSAHGRRDDGSAAAAVQAATWLAALQCSDGSLGVSATLPGVGWGTPLAMLLWTAVGGYDIERRKAASWMLREKGVAVPNLGPAVRAVSHDTTIVGWPWVAATHSWVEPTALAILALRRRGRFDHPRVREGIRLICDRAIASGGWNYGNNAAFGRDLRPQPAPSGLALLALAGVEGHSSTVEAAIAYLRDSLPGTRAPQSLCWGALGLKAWNCCPAAASEWLEEAFAETVRNRDPGSRLAHLLLAAGERSLDVVGVASPREVCHGA